MENPSRTINELFESYAEAFRQQDTKKMTHFYGLPCSFLSQEKNTVFTDASKLEGLFNQGTTHYRQMHISHCYPQVWSKHFLAPKMVRVHVKWDYYTDQDNLAYTCDYQYIMTRRNEEKWLIDVALALNEKERLEKWWDQRQQRKSKMVR